jgi:hypothetical protein
MGRSGATHHTLRALTRVLEGDVTGRTPVDGGPHSHLLQLTHLSVSLPLEL